MHLPTRMYFFDNAINPSDVLFSVVGIGVILSVSRLLEMYVPRGSQFVSYLGQNTLLILPTHLFIIKTLPFWLSSVPLSHLQYKIVEFGSIWLICLLLIPIVNRYAWFLVGKRRRVDKSLSA